jgi:hypothetical protein
MKVTSSIQTLVSWYDAVYLSIDCDVLCSLYRVLLHILTTCNTNTRVPCSLQNSLISEIWWQLPVLRCWCHDMILVSFDTLWSSVQSIQNHSSDSKHLQHGHPYSLFIAKFSNFWNMMATSSFQMLVSWYDSGIFWYTVVFCAVYTESFFIFWTPATWTPVVVVRFSHFWNMMASSGIQMLVLWYDSGYLSMYCGVLYSLNKVHLHIRNTCNRHPWSLQNPPISIYNVMATSRIQRLVSWYDSGIFRYTVVFCAVYAESFFTFWTPVTLTPVLLTELSNI